MASSTVTNSKYLDYEGLSHLKTVLDNRYANKSDIPTKVSQLTNDAGYTTANGHTHSYLPLSGGIMTGTINSQSIIPKTNTYNLGSSSLKWANVYAATFNGYLNGTVSMTAGTNNAYRNILVTNGSNGICYSSLNNVQLNYATGDLKATSFTGNLIGNVTGNVTGSADSISSNGYLKTLEDLNNVPVANQLRYNLYKNAEDTGLGFVGSDGFILTACWENTNYASQLALDDNGYNIAFRYKNTNWSDWKKLAFADGTGASGTWPISISGNAYYSSSAGYSATAGRATYSSSAGYTQYSGSAGYSATAGRSIYSASSATSLKFHPISTPFPPQGQAISPTNVYSIVGSNGGIIKRGTWNYAQNGHININDIGIIDLTGATVIQAANSNTQFTQLYLTSSTSDISSAKTNEILMYNYNGESYSPGWTRVLTNKNYSDYFVSTSTIDTLTDDTVSIVPNIPTSQIVNSGALRQFWVNVRNIIEDNEFVCAAALTDLNTRLDNINASISLSTPVSTTKYNILGSPTNGGNLNTAYCSTSVYMQGNNLYATSDARLKEFKEDIEVDLEKLRKLPKKYFTWKGESMIDIGTSAQELLKLYPELVSYDEVNDVYAVDYVKLSVIALAAVDTLYDRLKSTEDRLKAIEDKLSKLS